MRQYLVLLCCISTIVQAQIFDETHGIWLGVARDSNLMLSNTASEMTATIVCKGWDDYKYKGYSKFSKIENNPASPAIYLGEMQFDGRYGNDDRTTCNYPNTFVYFDLYLNYPHIFPNAIPILPYFTANITISFTDKNDNTQHKCTVSDPIGKVGIGWDRVSYMLPEEPDNIHWLAIRPAITNNRYNMSMQCNETSLYTLSADENDKQYGLYLSRKQ